MAAPGRALAPSFHRLVVNRFNALSLSVISASFRTRREMTECKRRNFLPETGSGMTISYRPLASILFVACYFAFALSSNALPQSSSSLAHLRSRHDPELRTTEDKESSLIKPMSETTEQGVDWLHLFEQSLAFMSFEHAFRCATEEGTRQGFNGPFWGGYLNSVGRLHGWSDGDPFLVNY